ncbi:glycosyltransferase family 4 protein [Aeromonas veronii]|uniref:glycosyltransferase family 4 protein n=1 Tax=Aeromonas veronii TaxID=654 RepID=UPI001C5B4C3C|nr:glycosyltransferase family 4 protein [Aeromonas veronii]
MFSIGIDASRNRSGGSKAHLIGVLNSIEPDGDEFIKIHLWTYKELANKISKKPWLVIHTPDEIEGNLLKQIFWQRFTLPKELRKNKVDILLSTDAGTVCRFSPSVVMSRDMLSFEDGEMARYFFSKSWLRLFLLKYLQIFSLKQSVGCIFLTNYAKSVISKYTGPLNNAIVIPHGVSENFRQLPQDEIDIINPKFIYVSNADKYKHQWHVIDAFYQYRKATGKDAHLTLVGAGTGPCADKVLKAMSDFDDGSHSVTILDFIAHSNIPDLLKKNDIFIFSSSCENMPNTLIEAMASGLPIICSNRGPMPEVMSEKGIFFDPELPESLKAAMIEICSSKIIAREQAALAFDLAAKYSWNRCSKETLKYLIDTANLVNR